MQSKGVRKQRQRGLGRLLPDRVAFPFQREFLTRNTSPAGC